MRENLKTLILNQTLTYSILKKRENFRISPINLLTKLDGSTIH